MMPLATYSLTWQKGWQGQWTRAHLRLLLVNANELSSDKYKYSKPSNNFGNFLPSSMYA